MKNIARIGLVLAAIVALVGCQPEPSVGKYDRKIAYTVKGSSTTVHLTSAEQYEALLDTFCNYAQEGNSVSFHNVDLARKSPATKDVEVYSTTNREEMKRWMAQKEGQGKTVTVSYDAETGTWNGMAYAVAPMPPAQHGTLIYSVDVERTFSYVMTFVMDSNVVYISRLDESQTFAAVDLPTGKFFYRRATEVNSPFAYHFIDSRGDTAGLYYMQFGNSFEVGGSDTLVFNSTRINNAITLHRTLHLTWCTYMCSVAGLDIVMHVKPGIPSVYPTQYTGQVGISGHANCTTPFAVCRFDMQRERSTNPDYDWELTLRYSQYSTRADVAGLQMCGEPFAYQYFEVIDPDGGCTRHYIFYKVD